MVEHIDSLLIESVNKPVAFFDADGMLVKTNRAWEMLCCEPSDAMLILTYDDLVEQFRLPPFDEMQVQDKSKTTFNRKSVVIIRQRLLLKNNHGIMVEVEDVTCMEENTALIDSTINDTMWKIRSRVASVQNVLTLLVDYSSETFSGQTGELLGATRREVWELSRHIENLRDMTAINSGAFPRQIHGERIDLCEMLDTIRIECGPIVPVEKRATALIVDGGSDGTLFSDRHICFKAVSSLVFNALTYTDGSAPVRVTVQREDGAALRITVQDGGWGIPHDEQNKIFSYGFRGERVQKANIAGLGVELYLVRKMLGMINSEIQFISKPGAGTQFDILLREMRKHG